MPAVVVCGKGGSGKSVLTTLLARASAEKGYRTLVVDTDESNLGLSRMLGLEPPKQCLIDYLGGKKEVSNKLIKALTDNGGQEIDVSLFFDDIEPGANEDYVSSKDGISLVMSGKILHFHEGCACPMGFAAKEFLDKLKIGTGDMVIVDTEAGIEHFGRGLDNGTDVVLAVIEASYESILLAERIFKIAGEAGICTLGILSKAEETSIPVLREELGKRGVELAGIVSNDPVVARACLIGQEVNGEKAKNDVGNLLEFLEKKIFRQSTDL